MYLPLFWVSRKAHYFVKETNSREYIENWTENLWLIRTVSCLEVTLLSPCSSYNRIESLTISVITVTVLLKSSLDRYLFMSSNLNRDNSAWLRLPVSSLQMYLEKQLCPKNSHDISSDSLIVWFHLLTIKSGSISTEIKLGLHSRRILRNRVALQSDQAGSHATVGNSSQSEAPV